MSYYNRTGWHRPLNKEEKISFEEYISLQDNSRNIRLKTTDGYKQNHLIRQHLADFLMDRFDWNYWVTFTFGFRPDMDEVEDVLFLMHERFDNRLLKHNTGKSMLSPKERSKWIMIPEIGNRGLHYHSFLNLVVHPNLGQSYEDEWKWVQVALKQTLDKLNPYLSNLGHGEQIGFRIYNRSLRTEDNLKMILYSMKEYGRKDFDRFAYTIISNMDWKPTPIFRRKTPTKLSDQRTRPNKIHKNSLV